MATIASRIDRRMERQEPDYLSWREICSIARSVQPGEFKWSMDHLKYHLFLLQHCGDWRGLMKNLAGHLDDCENQLGRAIAHWCVASTAALLALRPDTSVACPDRKDQVEDLRDMDVEHCVRFLALAGCVINLEHQRRHRRRVAAP